jgi:adenylate kinase family enzyme
MPVSAYYDRQDKLVNINGVGTIEEIFSKICNVLDPLKEMA